jgi:protocatechuate 3,4-dioxygenase beta subunit
VELSPASLSISGIQSSKALNLFVPIPIPGPPGQFRFTRTDSSGNYTFNTVRTGDYVVTASDHGYQRNSSASLTVAQGTNTAPTIALTANPTPVFGTVTGTVTDASGNPLAGATVLISPIARAIPLSASSNTSTGVVVFPPSSVQFATTDQNGQYSFSQVRSGTYTVTAFDKGFLKNTSASFTIVQGSNTVPPLALTARPTPVFGSVTGVVTDSNGAVLANALVEISPARSSTLASTNSFAGAGMVLPPIFPPGPIQVVRTDANGQYTFGKVRTGSYLVTASDRGYQKASSDAFTVAAGSNSAPTMKLSAQPTPTYGSVTGMVTDTGGTAIANALIEMYPALTTTPVAGANNPITAPIGIFPRRKFYIARTDQNGQYMLSDVRTGSYVVTAFAHGYQRQTSAAFTVALGSNTAPTLALATTTTPTQPL